MRLRTKWGNVLDVLGLLGFEHEPTPTRTTFRDSTPGPPNFTHVLDVLVVSRLPDVAFLDE